MPDATPLVAEAIRNAVLVQYEGVSTHVFLAEYLCAISLETSRTKDLLRVKMFLEQRAVDRQALQALVQRFGLIDALARVETL